MLTRNDFMTNLDRHYFPEEFSDEGFLFFFAFALESFKVCPTERMKGLKPKKERVCRFCGKKWGEVTFNRAAHVLSELLGNRYLVSDFECDDCNILFGTYEDQLSKYLGMSRTVMLARGKEGMPTFKPAGRAFRMDAEANATRTGTVTITREGANESFRYDAKKGVVEVVGKKHPYSPYAAYKSLVKMGLSCLSVEDIAAYPMALDFVTGKAFQEEGRSFAHLIRYVFPHTYGFETPMVFVFRKRSPESAVYTHTVMLFALNTIYAFALPFNSFDRQIPGGGLSFIHPPPLFSNPYHFPTSDIRKEKLDLSSDGPMRDEIDVLPIPVQLGGKLRVWVKNPVTGKVTKRLVSIDQVAGIHVDKVRRED